MVSSEELSSSSSSSSSVSISTSGSKCPCLPVPFRMTLVFAAVLCGLPVVGVTPIPCEMQHSINISCERIKLATTDADITRCVFHQQLTLCALQLLLALAWWWLRCSGVGYAATPLLRAAAAGSWEHATRTDSFLTLFILAFSCWQRLCCAASLYQLGNRKKYFPFILPLAFLFAAVDPSVDRENASSPSLRGGGAGSQMVCAGIARETPFQIVPSKARRLPTRRWSKTNVSRVKHGAPEASAAHTVHVCDGGYVLHGRWLPDRVSVPGDAAALGRDHRDPLRGWHEPFFRPVARYPFRVPAR